MPNLVRPKKALLVHLLPTNIGCEGSLRSGGIEDLRSGLGNLWGLVLLFQSWKLRMCHLFCWREGELTYWFCSLRRFTYIFGGALCDWVGIFWAQLTKEDWHPQRKQLAQRLLVGLVNLKLTFLCKQVKHPEHTCTLDEAVWWSHCKHALKMECRFRGTSPPMIEFDQEQRLRRTLLHVRGRWIWLLVLFFSIDCSKKCEFALKEEK